MSCKFLLQCGAIVTMALTLVSCDKDDENFIGSPMPISCGILDNGTSNNGGLPYGYRIYSMGNIQYGYNEDGRLRFISDGDDFFYFDKNLSFSFSEEDTYDGEYYEENFAASLNADGLITQGVGHYYEKDGDESLKADITVNVSYNPNKQISSVSINESWVEKEGKTTEKGYYKEQYTLVYSGTRLDRVEMNYTEKDDEIEHGYYIWTLNYASSVKNTFFQYTPYLIDCVFEETALPYFAPLGIVGRASSMLPSSISVRYSEGSSSGTYTITCGSYSFNSYGALSSADGQSYSYTTIGNKNKKGIAMQKGKTGHFVKKFCHRKRTR